MEKVHLTGLNGLRAIAALAVVFSHINISLSMFQIPPLNSSDLAGYGVTLFFALSGFLISLLLFKEKGRFQRIDIRKFYIRRILRIWPLYYLYLMIWLFSANLFFRETINYPSLLLHVFFFPNIAFIAGFPLPRLSHYWTLGVEEQFYSFWPLFLRKVRNPYRSLGLFIIIFLVVKVIFRLLDIGWGYRIPYAAITVSRFDCMAIGAIGAYVYFSDQRKLLKIIYSLPVQLISWGVVLLAAVNKFHLISLLDHEIFSVVTVVLIINLCSNSRTVIKLDYRLMDFLGKISFGIYVYHPLVIFFAAILLNHLKTSLTVKLFLIYSSVSLTTILVAYVSYEFYEKRFILLKERYSKVRSTSTKYSF